MSEPHQRGAQERVRVRLEMHSRRRREGRRRAELFFELFGRGSAQSAGQASHFPVFTSLWDALAAEDGREQSQWTPRWQSPQC